ncbi:uncharacterized protein LOC126680711 isoform X2 [Mercurialis annua]|uniref:uncharacterized protein LOC126680711 isoform X2 n=1 Tax=Mercurialis annua TaxID=3986 RepID=UPI002160C142|nr:uncharacterized protein LOC126680711 isoform X2 [Mercurialis annua]
MAEEQEETKKLDTESKSEQPNELTTANEGAELNKEEEKRMKPWEQHAAVISIPRFDYNAPSNLLNRSHSGFLVTCSIKREKSATKEVMSILQKYIVTHDHGTPEGFNGRQSTKRRKTLMGGICAEGIESESISEDDVGRSEETCKVGETSSAISLVKLTKSGLLLLTFVGESCFNVIDIVSSIFQHLESGNLKSPLWCHRIFPIQATCRLDEKELHTVVSKLVTDFMKEKPNKTGQTLKFAVAYNRRGIEETQAKNVKSASKDSNLCPLLERNKCFDVVASAVKDVVSDSAVDLKSPELSILVELLPVSGLGSLVAAVAVLPQNLVSIKPKLCIRPLVSDAGVKNKKQSKMVV